MPYLVEVRHLARAARLCMRRASAPGADGTSWARYRGGMRDRLDALAGRLRDGSWAPGPTRTVELTSYTGKAFAVVVPTVEDRIVHRAMRTALDPILEQLVLHDWVSGYRPGRNRVTAVRMADAHTRRGLRWSADVDVANASGGGDVEQFVSWLAAHVHDGPFLGRFRTALDGLPSPVMPGSGLWPSLFHLRLAQVDARLDDLAIVRFADNYVAFAHDQERAVAARRAIDRALASVGLGPHPRKSRLRPPHLSNPEDLFLIDG